MTILNLNELAMRQPDIEIYLKDAQLFAITDWLQSALGECTDWLMKGKVYHCQTIEAQIPITFYQKAVGNWHCLYFANNKTPWSNDLACALAANDYLNIEIRCAPNSWSETMRETDEQADHWLKIDQQQVIEFIWRTH